MSSSHTFVTLYGHFYQPPRDDPFTGLVPREPGATPYENYNEKITAECYHPNAVAGNFEHISFDLGPTLASWLERYHPDLHTMIVDSERRHYARHGVSNALAQAYNHTILPLASAEDKRTQIRWGLQDFTHRFGHAAEGMWFAETAVDLETLRIAAECGVRYTVLAPWQTGEVVDPTEPYRVELGDGLSIDVFFYNGPLSGGVSFDWDTTNNADNFAASYLPNYRNTEKVKQGDDQVIVVATDGELYGHHKQWRDRFLTHLLNGGAAAYSFEVVSLGRYLRDHQPQRTVTLRVPSAWSCSHGVARWSEGCDCTEGSSAWKPPLRAALDHLAVHLSDAYVLVGGEALRDPQAARDEYLALRNGWVEADAFWTRHARTPEAFASAAMRERTEQLLEAQYFGQAMSTSCGFFFEDLDRIEPRNDIAFARRAISLTYLATGRDLEAEFLRDLAESWSGRTGLTGADLYRQLPPLRADQVPSGADEPAA